MNNELLLLVKKHTYTLIEQTKTKPQETQEFKMIKQRQSFSFNPSINLAKEENWIMGVTSFECRISVFDITDENDIFSISIPDHWNSEELITKLNKLLELRSENDIEVYVKEVEKRGTRIEIENSG